MSIRVDNGIVKLSMFTEKAGTCLSFILANCEYIRDPVIAHICASVDTPDEVKTAVNAVFTGQFGGFNTKDMKVFELFGIVPDGYFDWLTTTSICGLASKVFQDFSGEVSVKLCQALQETQKFLSPENFQWLIETLFKLIATRFLNRKPKPFVEDESFCYEDCEAVCAWILNGEELPASLFGHKLGQIEQIAVESLLKELDRLYYAGENKDKTRPLIEEINKLLARAKL